MSTIMGFNSKNIWQWYLTKALFPETVKLILRYIYIISHHVNDHEKLQTFKNLVIYIYIAFIKFQLTKIFIFRT